MSKGRGGAKSAAQSVSLMAMMTALAFVLSWIESLFPPVFLAVPGIKLGLANVVVLMMLYVGGLAQAGVVSLVRVLMVGLVFASPSAMLFSLAGGALSLSVMALVKRAGWFSPMGVSMLGGVCHNVGQMLCHAALMGVFLTPYLPLMLASGAIAGAATGLLAAAIRPRLKRYGDANKPENACKV